MSVGLSSLMITHVRSIWVELGSLDTKLKQVLSSQSTFEKEILVQLSTFDTQSEQILVELSKFDTELEQVFVSGFQKVKLLKWV